jgi:hypothetical protein
LAYLLFLAYTPDPYIPIPKFEVVTFGNNVSIRLGKQEDPIRCLAKSNSFTETYHL